MMRDMDVTSTVGAFLHLADLQSVEERIEAWTTEYEAGFPDIFATYYAGWGSPARREHAARSAPDLVAGLRDRERKALGLVTSAAQSLVADRLLDDLDFQVVLLVGGGSSNGWTAKAVDVETLYLALEVLPKSPFDTALVFYELIHLAHNRRAGIDVWPQTVVGSLFCEGLATAASRRLVPGLSDSGYLWFDEQHNEWVRECADRSARIRTMVHSELETTAEESMLNLFSARPGSSVPTRCGYWLGDSLVDAALAGGHSVDDLMRLTYDEASQLMKEGLLHT